MTLPNKLTISRIFITPIFYFLFLYTSKMEFSVVRLILSWTLFFIWLYSEISDVIDGYLARKYNLTSDIGKILDPFADVLNRVTYFSLFVVMQWVSFWPLILIFWRELSITFIRAVVAKNGIAMGASSAGKTKAIFYFITSLLGMLYFVAINYTYFANITNNHITLHLFNIVFIITAVISLLSFIGYLKNFLNSSYIQVFIKE